MGKTSASRDRDSNEKINKWNIASQEKMNTQNLDFQRENLDYQKALQQQIFQREDSAYQRTVSDMRAAGLSPLTMNGTNSSGELVPTQALNAGVAPQKQGLYNHQEEMMNKIGAFTQMAQSISSLNKTAAEIRNINAQTDQVNFNNQFAYDTRQYSLARAEAEAIASRYDTLDKRQKFLYDQHFGLNSGMTKIERYSAIMSTMLGYSFHQSPGQPEDLRQYYEDFDKNLNTIDKYAKPKNMDSDDYKKVIDATMDTISSTIKSALPVPNISVNSGVAGPAQTAVDLLNTGRSKDNIEKDFEIYRKAQSGEKLNWFESLQYKLMTDDQKERYKKMLENEKK